MTDYQTDILLALIATSVFNWLSAAWLRYTKVKRFVKVGTVSGLTLFPIKSCKGISLQLATAEVTGLHNNGITDRQWMLLGPSGEFLTQRQYPKMALIRTSFDTDNVCIEAPDQPALILPNNPNVDRSKFLKTRVWASPLPAMDCGEEVAQWFSSYIGVSGLRLVVSTKSMPKRESRVHIPWGSLTKPGDVTTFSDFCGYLVMNEASLHALNERLQNKVTMDSFRPSIVISGPKAFDEDAWQEIRIGGSNPVYFRILEPCARCLLTTVNPKTGEKDKTKQPLETLKQFRCFPQYGNDPIFGINAAIDNIGTVRVGDPVYALLK